MRDTWNVLNYLQERSPFTPNASLRNISTGINVHSTVNADNARDIANAILESMEGKTVGEYTFMRKNQAVTYDTKSSVKIGDDAVHIDPQLVFQHLTIAAMASDCLECVFKYELCTFPPAIFDSSSPP